MGVRRFCSKRRPNQIRGACSGRRLASQPFLNERAGAVALVNISALGNGAGVVVSRRQLVRTNLCTLEREAKPRAPPP